MLTKQRKIMDNARKPQLDIIDLGRTDYRECWDLQKDYVRKRAEGNIPDTLLLTEHNPVITLGRGTDRKNLLASDELLKQKGVDLYEIERGGDITFHGPGQLVAYPVINLTLRGRDLHKYLRDLENVTIKTLNSLGLKASIKHALTGVWIEDSKVAAIGVGVSRWITYHGLALNVNTDLNYFQLINPCGITEYPVSSIASITNTEADFENIKGIFITNFADYFGYSIKDEIHHREQT